MNLDFPLSLGSSWVSFGVLQSGVMSWNAIVMGGGLFWHYSSISRRLNPLFSSACFFYCSSVSAWKKIHLSDETPNLLFGITIKSCAKRGNFCNNSFFQHELPANKIFLASTFDNQGIFQHTPLFFFCNWILHIWNGNIFIISWMNISRNHSARH